MSASPPLDFLPTYNILTGLYNKENCYNAEKHTMIKTENKRWTNGCAVWERTKGSQKQKSSTEKESGYERDSVKEV